MTRTIKFSKVLNPEQIDKLSCQEVRNICCDDCGLCTKKERDKKTVCECKNILKAHCY